MAKPKVEDVVKGKGPEAVRGKTVEVHYTGWLEDGTKFDSSVGGQPFSFRIGAGEVIEGWERGVVGMKVGGKRKLTLPPDLAYGAAGAVPTPAHHSFRPAMSRAKRRAPQPEDTAATSTAAAVGSRTSGAWMSVGCSSCRAGTLPVPRGSGGNIE